jgi:hypothetical protein
MVDLGLSDERLLEIGRLAVAMQRLKDEVLDWIVAEAKAGGFRTNDQAPAWRAHEEAADAFFGRLAKAVNSPARTYIRFLSA